MTDLRLQLVKTGETTNPARSFFWAGVAYKNVARIWGLLSAQMLKDAEDFGKRANDSVSITDYAKAMETGRTLIAEIATIAQEQQKALRTLVS